MGVIEIASSDDGGCANEEEPPGDWHLWVGVIS